MIDIKSCKFQIRRSGKENPGSSTLSALKHPGPAWHIACMLNPKLVFGAGMWMGHAVVNTRTSPFRIASVEISVRNFHRQITTVYKRSVRAGILCKLLKPLSPAADFQVPDH